jgi:hypothetical protein
VREQFPPVRLGVGGEIALLIFSEHTHVHEPTQTLRRIQAE